MKRALAAIAGAFDKSDIPIALFFVALVLIGYGLTQIHRGLGLAVDGALLLLYVRPASRLIR